MPRKQNELPGVEAEHIQEIEEAADRYVTVRDKRMKLTEQEVVAKVNLIQTLIDHQKELSPDADGNRTYRFDDLLVIFKSGKPTVKVKHEQDGDDEDEEE